MKPEAVHFDDAQKEFEFTPGGPLPFATLLRNEGSQDPMLLFTNAQDGAIPKRPRFADLTEGDNIDWHAIGDAQITATIAASAIHRTRYLMARGTLNNRQPREDELNDEHAPPNYENPTCRPGYLCEPLSPAYLDSVGNSIHAKVYNTWQGHNLGQFASLLGRYYAGVRLQAGVCSNVSAVAAAMMTMHAPVEGQFYNDIKKLRHTDDACLSILDISHAGNHSFCIVSFGNSPWFVCDPWVAEPYVLPLEENYFPEAGINAWSEIRVFRRLEHPFGLPSMSLWDADHGDAGKNVANFPVDAGVIRVVERYIQSLNINFGANMMPNDAFHPNGMPNEDVFRLCPPAENEVSRRIAPKFHTGHVWGQATNHKLDDDDTAAEWKEYRSRNRPVAMGNEWGMRVNQNPGYVTQHNEGVDFDSNTYA